MNHMKKVINGKMYNTETAKYCGGYEFSNVGDFNHVCEDLYRKKTGEFFLYGEGGAMSKYCEEVGNNSWTGGEKIIPLTIKEAKRWSEKHLNADTYIELFGEVEE